MHKVIVTAALCFAIGSAQAQEVKQVGTWMVQTTKDRFTEDTNVIAMTINNGGVLAVRCLSPGRHVTLAIKSPGVVRELSAGEKFLVSFKGGKSPVLNTLANAVDSEMLEVFVTKAMRPVFLTADDYAFRVRDQNTQFDVVFDAGTAGKALPPVFSACPPDKDDSNAEPGSK
jgi:hypothetical protein